MNEAGAQRRLAAVRAADIASCPRLAGGVTPMRWRGPMSKPKILAPTGVRMPVESIYMRALIGMVQILITPGRRSI